MSYCLTCVQREYNTVLTRRQEYEERYRSRQPHVSNDQLEAVALRNTGSPVRENIQQGT